MEVAKATLTGITKRINNLHTIYQLTIVTMMFFKATDSMNCPKHCKCFPVLPNDLFDPPTYSRVLESTNNTLTAVSCQRQQLTYVPKGLPSDTAVLFLSHNGLTHLNRSMFTGLTMIQCLDVSHNLLKSIANDTFDGMTRLEQLDISNNLIEQVPKGFLCPWHNGGFITANKFDCKEHPTAKTVLRLSLAMNHWSCTCRLQQFVEHFSCAGIFRKSPCIEFYSNGVDPIGKCEVRSNLPAVEITKLSSSKDGKDNVNACKLRGNRIDVPLLVTMFTWMGAVFGYVIYFIWWNQREIRNHRSYLATLHKRPQRAVSEPRSRVEERPLTTDSVFIRTPHESGKALPEQYEMRPLRKEKPPNVHKGEQTASKESTAEVWVQRSDADVSKNSDDYGLQSHTRIIHVQPYIPHDHGRAGSSEPPTPRGKTKNSEIYCISSL